MDTPRPQGPLMAAIVLRRAGGPEGLEQIEVPKPVPRADEVLVRVEAASVGRGDIALRRIPAIAWPLVRRLTGLQRKRILGHEFAGTIEAIGSRVHGFRPGDAVFGTTTGTPVGSHAEYLSLPETGSIARIPANLSWTEAAALPVGALTALRLLRAAHVEAGTRLLIYGATGSVGSAALQLAAHAGAHVTAATSPGNFGLVRQLGAEEALDYGAALARRDVDRFDVVLDAVGKIRGPGRAALRLGGRFVTVRSLAREPVGWLDEIGRLAEGGALRPLIDRSYPLAQIREAHRYVEAGHKRGNVVLVVANSGGRSRKAGAAQPATEISTDLRGRTDAARRVHPHAVLTATADARQGGRK